jgi:hypothetical protein
MGLLSVGAHAACAPIGREVARGLSLLVPARPTVDGELRWVVLEPTNERDDSSVEPVERGRARARSGGRGSESRGRGRLPGVRIQAERVLRLAMGGARPRGIPVPAGYGHPAGIAVFGASNLGIGVKDGDVLAQVDGMAVTEEAEVVTLILSARGARARSTSGILWRGTRSYALVVEQPYPQAGAESGWESTPLLGSQAMPLLPDN